MRDAKNHHMKLHVDLGFHFVELPPSPHTVARQVTVALLALSLYGYMNK